MSKPETIEDIVREMRTLGRLDEKSTDKIPRSLQALGLRTYADRIEAAAKREVVISQTDTTIECPHKFNAEKLGVPFYVEVGTSIAAIRCTSNHDVIDRCDRTMYGKGVIDDIKRLCVRMNEEAAKWNQPVTKCNGLNAAKMREVLDEIRVAAMSDYEPDADYLIEKCNAALSAPARNCDRFANWEEAFDAFYDSLAIEHMPMRDGVSAAFWGWLFAEAKTNNK